MKKLLPVFILILTGSIFGQKKQTIAYNNAPFDMTFKTIAPVYQGIDYARFVFALKNRLPKLSKDVFETTAKYEESRKFSKSR